MADNFSVTTNGGVAVVIGSKDLGGGVQAAKHVIVDTSGNFQPAGDVAARGISVTPGDGTNAVTVKAASTLAATTDTGLVVRPLAASDGTHTTPIGDASAREIFVGLADGTNGPAAIKAASTAAIATDLAVVVSVSPNSPVKTNADGVAAGGTLATKSLLAGAQFLAYGSLPALTTGQGASLQSDAPGNLKVGVTPLGTPIYGSANGAAQANNVTLTIPSAKMGYLDGFDVDGCGATLGGVVAITVVGLLGGTLTFDLGVPTGVAVPISFSKKFNPPLQASAVNTNIVVNVPSLGAGNPGASTNAYGHYI